jgi:hyperosmotically inducible protein
MKTNHAFLIAAICALGMAQPAFSADRAAHEQAEVDYKVAKAECKKMSGADRTACLRDAKARNEQAEIAAKAAHERAEAKSPEERAEVDAKAAHEQAEAVAKAARK